MAEHVQHRRILGQPLRKGLVRPLVEEQPGLLPTHQIGQIGGTVHRNGHGFRGRLPAQDLHPFVQAFQPTRAALPVQDHGGHARHPDQRIRQVIRHPVRPGSVRLDHRRVAEPVDHQAGQPVGLGMDEAIEGCVIQPFPQLQGARQLRGQPFGVDHGPGVGVHHPAHDLAVGVDRHQSQGLALGILQHRKTARRDRAAAAVQHGFVGEDPGKSVADRLGLGFWAQAQHGQIGHRVHPFRAPDLAWRPARHKAVAGSMPCLRQAPLIRYR